MMATDTKRYIQVYTGDGKGKTTAAFGLALRAEGAGIKVFIGQFVKGKTYNENVAIARCLKNITIKHKNRMKLKSGNYIKISIRDHGTGIQPDVLPKIFNPFFTTKEDKLGLGLPVAYSIAKNHGGTIDVNTEPGKGSTFHIFLPASEVLEKKKDVTVTIKESRRKFQKILVMDDDPVILSIIMKLLSKLGYQSDQAVKGQEVLEKFKIAKKEKKPFDLIILDLNINQLGYKMAVEAVSVGIVSGKFPANGKSTGKIFNFRGCFGALPRITSCIYYIFILKITPLAAQLRQQIFQKKFIKQLR